MRIIVTSSVPEIEKLMHVEQHEFDITKIHRG